MNIAFLSNWERTDTWIAVGAELARRGTNVFFVVTRDEYVAKAMAAGVDRSRILWLNRSAAERAEFSQQDIELLEHYEYATGDRIRNFILMDRFMRSERQDWAMQYSRYVFRELLHFLEDNKIDVVSGQPDNIPDLIALMILRFRGRGKYAAPFEFRLPEKRFVLWDSAIEQTPHITGARSPDEVTPDEIEAARRLRKRVLEGGKQRVLSQDQQPRIGASYLQRLARGFFYRALVVSRHDVYMYNLRSIFFDLKYHMIAINYRLTRLLWRRIFERGKDGERFVLFTLNYAPEHTIDVEAPHFVSPLETVRNMTRSMPSDIVLYVKEHPNALGIRGPSELFRIKRLPGVRLIDPFVDSHDLIKRAEAVVTLSGTASLEAAIYGKRTILLSDIFIKNFSTCERAFAPWEIGDLLLRKPERDYSEERDLRYLAFLYSNSHPGTVIEPLTDPSSLGPENIGLVADAYSRLFATMPRESASGAELVATETEAGARRQLPV
jgi:hypothetical protein